MDQSKPHHQHHQGGPPHHARYVPPADVVPAHASHGHDVGPDGATYELRFIDAMVLQHRGALRMSEFSFDIGQSDVEALGVCRKTSPRVSFPQPGVDFWLNKTNRRRSSP